MTSPISSRARDYVRSRATEVMAYQCRIERVAKASYDDETLIATPGSRTVIYEGVCRIWEIVGSTDVFINDADYDVSHTQISTPWDAPIAFQNDEVVITAAPVEDLSLVNSRYQIQSHARAGELRATRRYLVTGPSW